MLIRARGEVVGDRRHGAIISHTMHLNAPGLLPRLTDRRQEGQVCASSIAFAKARSRGFRDRYATRDPKQIRVIR